MGECLVVLRLCHVVKHFCQGPGVRRVTGQEDRVGGGRLLEQLDGHGNQISLCGQVKQGDRGDHLKKQGNEIKVV